jgi:hypothetical protein
MAAYETITVAIICEYTAGVVAAHRSLESRNDDSSYTCGRIGTHNVLIAGLPTGCTGSVAAMELAMELRRQFASIQLIVYAGTASGLPKNDMHIHLADVVIADATATGLSVVGHKRDVSDSEPSDIVQAAISGFRNQLERHILNTFVCGNTISKERKPTIHFGQIATSPCLSYFKATRDKLIAAGNLCLESRVGDMIGQGNLLIIVGIRDCGIQSDAEKWTASASRAAVHCAVLLLRSMEQEDGVSAMETSLSSIALRPKDDTEDSLMDGTEEGELQDDWEMID